jgi:isochorismate hydrolase
MNTIVNLRDFKACGREPPTLLLVDLHHDVDGIDSPEGGISCEALVNCRAVLRHARACHIPVAFTRLVAAPKNMLASPVYPRWIEGMEPSRWDMVFDRQRPSCYASAEFREIAEQIGGNYVIAGRFGELSCLSTAVDAFHHDHRPIVLSDALMCGKYDDLSAAAMRRALSCIFSQYELTVGTQVWIHASSRRVGVVK